MTGMCKMQHISLNNQIEYSLCKLKIFKLIPKAFKKLKTIQWATKPFACLRKGMMLRTLFLSCLLLQYVPFLPYYHTVVPYVFCFLTITNPVFLFLTLCSALIRSFYLSFHLSIKGCAWFPSRVQQFLSWMTRSWHHAPALHLAVHCSALVGDCLGFWSDV